MKGFKEEGGRRKMVQQGSTPFLGIWGMILGEDVRRKKADWEREEDVRKEREGRRREGRRRGKKEETIGWEWEANVVDGRRKGKAMNVLEGR
jgi:hypothetical protein